MSKSENTRKLSEAQSFENKAKILREEVERNHNNCSHKFGDAKYDPITKFESFPIPGTNVGQGSHYWPEMGKKEVSLPRWSRECSECGKVEYTTKQEESVTKKPKF